MLFTGRDPILQSPFRLGACMAIPAMAGGVEAAAVWRERTGQAQELSIDLRQAVYGIAPWVRFLVDYNIAAGTLPPNWLPPEWTWRPTLNGGNLQGPFILGNPLGFQVFETKDGRLVTPTGIYPHHFIGFLALIGAGPEPQQIAQRIRTFDSLELEQMVGEAGMIMGIHRTAAEWAAHPQGQAIANIPVVEIIKIGDSDPIPWANNPTAPLSGIRVLSNSHVIASSTASRTLAGYGAEVLHVAREQGFEHEALVVDVNVGMRSTMLDLKNPEQNRVQQRLVARADVFVEGFRGRKMEELGFGAEQVARMKPGIVYLSVRPYGWEGPWKMYAGFDMEALTVTGFTLIQGGGQRPRFPPTFVMNDYIAGYMGAAGVIAALRRRARGRQLSRPCAPRALFDMVPKPRPAHRRGFRTPRAREPARRAGGNSRADALWRPRAIGTARQAFPHADRLARAARSRARRRQTGVRELKRRRHLTRQHNGKHDDVRQRRRQRRCDAGAARAHHPVHDAARRLPLYRRRSARRGVRRRRVTGPSANGPGPPRGPARHTAARRHPRDRA